MKPILNWPGGKARIVKHLLPLIPPHKCYCEPFAGGLALLFAKPRSPVEVINDFDGDLITFYRCARRHPDELARLIGETICSRRMFFEAIQQPGLTDLERAASFWVKNKDSFGCRMRSFLVCKTPSKGVPNPRSSIATALNNLSARLERVVIENIPYGRVLTNQDSPDTFFFIDPPYIGTDGGIYAQWTVDDLKTLAATIRKLRARWLLTINDHPAARPLFPNFQIRQIESDNRGDNHRIHPPRRLRELIITSP